MGKGEVSEGVSAHADLAPTILGLAGVKGEEWGWEGLDGKAIMLGGDVEEKERGEHVSVEFWGKAIAEGEGGFSLDEGRVGECPFSRLLISYVPFLQICFYIFQTKNWVLKLGPQERWTDEKPVVFKANNTYKALRVISKEYNLYYSVWCTNEHELYDLTVRFLSLYFLSPDHPIHLIPPLSFFSLSTT